MFQWFAEFIKIIFIVSVKWVILMPPPCSYVTAGSSCVADIQTQLSSQKVQQSLYVDVSNSLEYVIKAGVFILFVANQFKCE